MMPADAEAYWLAPKTRSDQFLLFAFDVAQAWDGDVVREALLARACTIAELNLVARETPANLDYPYWVARVALSEQVAERSLPGPTWQCCLDDVASLIADQVDPRRATWRVHLYPRVTGLPDRAGPGSVAVLQISHALADGRGSTALARRLFAVEPVDRPVPLSGDSMMLSAVKGMARLPIQFGHTVTRGWRAYRLSVGDGAGPRPSAPGPLNRPPGTDRQLRVVVVDSARLRVGSHGVTVGAIIVIAEAMAAAGLVGDDGRVVVELTIARRGTSQAHNNFYTAGIDTHAEITDRVDRADAIAAEIDAARERDESAGRVAARRAAEATPAPLMRWGTVAFDPTKQSSAVSGHTVVSSVNRGAADIGLAGGRVRFTAGFPAISTMQGLTHGIHGIGSTVAISVTTSLEVLPDIDGYVARLRDAGAGMGQSGD